MAEVATATLSALPGPVSRKSSKSGDLTSSKKRHRESNHIEKPERKHKRSKSDAAPIPNPPAEPADGGDSTLKRKRKGHKSSRANDSHTDEGQLLQDKVATPPDTNGKGGDDGEKRSKRKKTDKTDKKEKKKSKRSRESQDQVHGNNDNNNDNSNDNHDNDDDASTAHGGVVVLDSSLSTTFPGAGEAVQVPISLLYPDCLAVSPTSPFGFGGVLLAYRSPRIGEAPGQGSLTENSGMEDMALLESVNEAAVSFGLVNIQSGGHIGVVCWNKFNASIESERLPRDWRWVDQHSSKRTSEAEAETTSPSPEAQDDTEADHTEVHATGYWVDGQGSKITAESPICFRIKNYEVGSSGDYGYLSIEGTMLTEEEEQKKARKEREVQQRKLSRGIVPRRERRPLLELGMTKFTNDDGRDPESQRAEA
ncbi:hypothetical protein E0Z10_g7980 [Xylaria hypoxylon]|uniref:RPA43 OB domain-containing protein n=1 Tax=Xylaria hypoxylon TaxID=37992 RepID=A0A4Z0Y9E1_9PEZI|nr:hypothetical protein E0Z10_g7980 [Xylaria hypoxylon]